VCLPRRQPILYRSGALIAFELLFRAGTANIAQVTDEADATVQVIARLVGDIGLRAALGGHTAYVNVDRTALTSDQCTGTPDGVANEREAAEKNVLSRLEAMKEKRQITVRSGVQGVEIGVDARILFNPGDASLLPQSFVVLGEIATALRKQTDNNTLVEGHTDSAPISNARYASNWEFSSAVFEQVVHNPCRKGKRDGSGRQCCCGHCVTAA